MTFPPRLRTLVFCLLLLLIVLLLLFVAMSRTILHPPYYIDPTLSFSSSKHHDHSTTTTTITTTTTTTTTTTSTYSSSSSSTNARKALSTLSFHPVRSFLFLFLAHNVNTTRGAIAQLKRMYTTQDLYYLHFDYTDGQESRLMLDMMERACADNLWTRNVYYESRISVKYRKLSMVEPFLLGLNVALCHWSDHQWDYAINLSGDSLMLGSRQDLIDRHEALCGMDWVLSILHTDEPALNCSYFVQYDADHVESLKHHPSSCSHIKRNDVRKFLGDGRRSVPTGVFFGSEWFSLTRATVHRLFATTDAENDDFKKKEKKNDSGTRTTADRRCVAAMSPHLPVPEREANDARLNAFQVKHPLAEWTRDLIPFTQTSHVVDEMFIPSLVMNPESGSLLRLWSELPFDERPKRPNLRFYFFVEGYHSVEFSKDDLRSSLSRHLNEFLDEDLNVKAPMILRKVPFEFIADDDAVMRLSKSLGFFLGD